MKGHGEIREWQRQADLAIRAEAADAEVRPAVMGCIDHGYTLEEAENAFTQMGPAEAERAASLLRNMIFREEVLVGEDGVLSRPPVDRAA